MLTEEAPVERGNLRLPERGENFGSDVLEDASTQVERLAASWGNSSQSEGRRGLLGV